MIWARLTSESDFFLSILMLFLAWKQEKACTRCWLTNLQKVITKDWLNNDVIWCIYLVCHVTTEIRSKKYWFLHGGPKLLASTVIRNCNITTYRMRFECFWTFLQLNLHKNLFVYQTKPWFLDSFRKMSLTHNFSNYPSSKASCFFNYTFLLLLQLIMTASRRK